MGYAAVHVADVDLFVGTANRDLGLSRFFESAHKAPTAKLDVLCAPVPADHTEICPLFEANELHLVIDDVQRDLFDILRHVAYLASAISACYSFVHAAGVVVRDKGVLLIGRSGTGKSTLVGLLGGQVLDDDMLMVNEGEMRRVSRFGAHIQKDGHTVRLIEDENYRAEVDCIFVLDKSAEPSRVEPLAPADIRARDTFDDNLHPGLFARYDEKKTPAFHAPIYRIGTKRAPRETKRVIDYILEHL